MNQPNHGPGGAAGAPTDRPAGPVLEIPELSLVLLIGASGSGKSVFAKEHFEPFEVVSSDFCRGLVSSDPANQAATKDAFDVLDLIVSKRLARGLLTVVDATNVQAAARKSLIALAREHDVLPVGIVLDMPVSLCVARNRARGVPFGDNVPERQARALKQSLKGLGREGLRHVYRLTGPEEATGARVSRTKLYNDKREDAGPFDVIGDVHGCFDELAALLGALGYTLVHDAAGRAVDAAHPAGRRVVFVGDVVDRGPRVADVLRLAMGMTAAGNALAVQGNHEAKLARALRRGSKVQPTHGLDLTLAALAEEGPQFTAAAAAWAEGLISHYVFDSGRLVVAHAGLKEAYQGRASGRVRSFALYGDTTGESDEYGLPVRLPWAEDYRGRAMVLYGHTPVPELEWVNNTLCLDTGCVFGGKLSALRYPEKELVSVPAARVYCEPARPLGAGTADTGAAGATDSRPDDVLDADDVLGKRGVETRLMGRVAVKAEQAAGAFEAMSRFAVAPGRLAYLPPTMAPVDASAREGYLEHPAEAFAYFARAGVDRVICEEKHMGSRAVVWLARSPGGGGPKRNDGGSPGDQSGNAAIPPGGIGGPGGGAAIPPGGDGPSRNGGGSPGDRSGCPAVPPGGGVIHTRTGRPFFGPELEAQALDRLRAATDRAGLWDELGADWVLIDAELLPWSLKAEGLLRAQYRPVGASAAAMYAAAIPALEAAADRGLEVADLLARARTRRDDAAAYAAVVERYAWAVDGLDGVQLAPFQLLACGTSPGGAAGPGPEASRAAGGAAIARDGTAGDRPGVVLGTGPAAATRALYSESHERHMGWADRLAEADPTFVRPTRNLVLDPADPAAAGEAAAWWEDLTAAGGEGMVVKPLAGPAKTGGKLVQPGLKVRGREYLRMTYGPDYLNRLPDLRQRKTGFKRSLALREYALGLEAVDRLVAGEPLWRRHEAVFAVLALESEPTDPRL
ncbi:MAG: polynucleotide kinase-phosphatase [Bifidobacteriaceae bacterium]|jgi:predicted kinase/diadenosine tetraphosphatase ApaH/serine/threonine PP2A family protein phosphatase|nr:polynucleotide kinase-phosphatase [Bifidobacteriaceae bacterium]